MPSSRSLNSSRGYNTTVLVVLVGLVVQALISIYVNPRRTSTEANPEATMPAVEYIDEGAKLR